MHEQKARMVRKLWWDTPGRKPAKPAADMAAVESQVEQLASEIEAAASEVDTVESQVERLAAKIADMAAVESQVEQLASEIEAAKIGATASAEMDVRALLTDIQKDVTAIKREFVPAKFFYFPHESIRMLWTTMKVVGSNGVTHELDPGDFDHLKNSYKWVTQENPIILHLEKGYTWRLKATGPDPDKNALHVNGTSYGHRGMTFNLDVLHPLSYGFSVGWGLQG